MKATIIIKYKLEDQEGLPPKIEHKIKELMEGIGAEKIGSGFEGTTLVRDLEYEIDFGNEAIKD